MSDLVFRTWDWEKGQIAKRNRDKTDYILSSAGITPDHPDYIRYYRATISNVHNAYRFSYNGETEADLEKVFESFVEAIKDSSIEKYEQVSKAFLEIKEKEQIKKAEGHNAFRNPGYYDKRKILDKIIESGLELRRQKKSEFS